MTAYHIKHGDLEKIKNDILSLSSRNELLEKILASIPSTVYVRDINLKFLIVNIAFENFVGKKAKDIIEKTDFEVLPKNHADFFVQKDRELLNNKRNLFILMK